MLSTISQPFQVGGKSNPRTQTFPEPKYPMTDPCDWYKFPYMKTIKNQPDVGNIPCMEPMGMNRQRHEGEGNSS